MNSEVFVHVVVRSHEFRPAGDLALQQGDYSNNSHADMSEPGIPSREQYQLEGVGSRIPTLSPLSPRNGDNEKDLGNMPTFVRRLCHFVLAPFQFKVQLMAD